MLTADVDADVGLISCVRRGVGQIARLHPSGGAAQGCVLVPVSSIEVGVAVGGVEQNDEKSGMSRRGA